MYALLSSFVTDFLKRSLNSLVEPASIKAGFIDHIINGGSPLSFLMAFKAVDFFCLFVCHLFCFVGV